MEHRSDALCNSSARCAAREKAKPDALRQDNRIVDQIKRSVRSSDQLILLISFALLSARFRRNDRDARRDYVVGAMIYVFDVATHMARLCLHAGRLHSGV